MKCMRARGFTLLEIMIVIIIIGIATTGVALSVGATDRAKLRSSCWTIASAAKYAYSHAVSQGMTVRLALDFKKRTIQLEETKGRVVLNREDETGEGLNREDDEIFSPDGGPVGKGMLDHNMGSGSTFRGMSTQTNPMGAQPMNGMGMGLPMALGTGMGAGMDNSKGDNGTSGISALMNNIASGSQGDPYLSSMQQGGVVGQIGYSRPKFKPIGGKRGKARELDGHTIFKTVFTPHSPKPQEEGRAFIYFFPGGVTEHSIVQLSDGEDRVYSVEIHPLTGRAVIFNEAIEPEDDLEKLQEAEE